MAVIAWTDDFATGLGVVDRQHRRLVVLINRLAEALVASPRIDSPALACAYQRLRDHAASHFSDEERLMVNGGIDSRHAETHRQAHVQLIELIDSLWQSRTAISNPAEALLDVVSPWFVQHTLGVDKLMAFQIKLLRQGETAERSYELASAARPSESYATLDALRQLFQTLSRRNLALEQSARERTRELESVNLKLTHAYVRLNRQDQSLENQIRARTQKLERANRVLTAANQRLKNIACTDGLLNIANRASFDERLDGEWRRAGRDALPLSLLMIDVDHFKLFNDTYGHLAGDRCLQSIAQTLAALTHRPGDFVARYGGEEFVVVLPNTDIEGARSCAEQIRERIRSMQIVHGTSDADCCVTVSIGASCRLPGYTAVSAAELVRQADEGLYRAKSEGRNCVRCFRDETKEISEGVALGAKPPVLPGFRLSLPRKNDASACAR